MGFRAPKRHQVALFFEGDLAGLEAIVKSPSEKTLRAVMRLADLSSETEPTEEDQGIVRALLFAFTEDLIEWNLEDSETGEPVPASQEGIETQDGEFIMRIVAAWVATLRRVPRVPRVRTEMADEPSSQFEASLPMVAAE